MLAPKKCHTPVVSMSDTGGRWEMGGGGRCWEGVTGILSGQGHMCYPPPESRDLRVQHPLCLGAGEEATAHGVWVAPRRPWWLPSLPGCREMFLFQSRQVIRLSRKEGPATRASGVPGMGARLGSARLWPPLLVRD